MKGIHRKLQFVNQLVCKTARFLKDTKKGSGEKKREREKDGSLKRGHSFLGGEREPEKYFSVFSYKNVCLILKIDKTCFSLHTYI